MGNIWGCEVTVLFVRVFTSESVGGRMTVSEVASVMYLELVIFGLLAVGLQQVVASTFLTPVVWSLGLLTVVLVIAAMFAALWCDGLDIVLPDPKWEWLQRIVAVTTGRMKDGQVNPADPVDLTLTEENVREMAQAACDLQTAFTLVYYLHVSFIWAVGDEEDTESDYWWTLFQLDWTAPKASMHMTKLNVVVSVVMLAVLQVISFVLNMTFLRPKRKEWSEQKSVRHCPSGFWFLAVGVSQVIQYTLFLYAMQQKITNKALFMLALIPWVADLVCNAIVAERLLHMIRANTTMYLLPVLVFFRVATPTAMLVFCMRRMFVYIHNVFWYVNLALLGAFIASRLLECFYEIKDRTPEVAKEQKTRSIFTKPHRLGVRQPSIFFKAKGHSSKKDK